MKIKYPINWKLGITDRIMNTIIFGRQENFFDNADKAFEAAQDEKAVEEINRELDDNVKGRELEDDNLVEIEK